MRRLLLGLCGLALAAQAPPPGPGRGDWNVQLGAMVLEAPKAPGAAETWLLPLPVFSAEYRERLFLGSSPAGLGLGAGFHLQHSRRCTWDLGLGVREPRRESRADELAGMGNRGAGVFAGTALKLQAGHWHGSLGLAAGLGAAAGLRGTLALGLGGPLGGRWLGSLTASAGAAEAKAMAYDFGVDSAQAQARTALLAAGDPRLRPGEDRPWAPGGGLQELALAGHLGYRVDAHWSGFGLVKAARLQGDAKASPLTRQPTGLTAGMGFSYQF